MHISLPATMEAFINKQVESGMYTSASEVIREAVHLWAKQKQNRDYDSEETQLARLQEKIDLSQQQLDEGKGEPFTVDTVKDIEQRGKARLKKK